MSHVFFCTGPSPASVRRMKRIYFSRLLRAAMRRPPEQLWLLTSNRVYPVCATVRHLTVESLDRPHRYLEDRGRRRIRSRAGQTATLFYGW